MKFLKNNRRTGGREKEREEEEWRRSNVGVKEIEGGGGRGGEKEA